MDRIGVLLINVGTPDEPTPEAVGKYLRQFLMDGRVLDMPFMKRWLLVNRVIVPRRKEYSPKHYQEIWTDEGLPLLIHTRNFAAELTSELSNREHEYFVEIGMRYGNPSIHSALSKLKSNNVDRIVAMPLYPQYTQSSFETAVVETEKRARQLRLADRLSFVRPFYDDPGFVNVSANLVTEHLNGNAPDHILFSFHSVPTRHVKQLEQSAGHCLTSLDCCNEIGPTNQGCYRAQCFATSRAVARELGLSPDQYTTCFQSQLGKDEWIGPALDDLLRDLPDRGVRKVAVFCPSFVADCLETLEEIGIRGREEFKEAGGEELTLIPCLNSDQRWIKAAADLIVESTREPGHIKAASAGAHAATH
jgi:ferrochelatase